VPDFPLTLALSREGRGDVGVLPARFMGDDSWRMRHGVSPLPSSIEGEEALVLPFGQVRGQVVGSESPPDCGALSLLGRARSCSYRDQGLRHSTPHRSKSARLRVTAVRP
jgi:hypothetical protein